jgi:hypothetical protein
MILEGHVTLCVLRRPSATCSNSIWISDAALADAVQRFTCVHQRHGSSVPGPLEAIRRATRRKNASLAPGGRGALPIDAEALFGGGRKGEWWNTPNSSALEVEVPECEISGLLLCSDILMEHSSSKTTFMAHRKTTIVASNHLAAKAICI